MNIYKSETQLTYTQDENAPNKHNDILETLSQYCTVHEKNFNAGERLHTAGEPVKDGFVVKSGIVKLLRHLPCGKTRIVRLCSAGDLVGFEGLFDPNHTHTAVAINRVHSAQVSLNGIKRIEDKDIRQYCEILKQLYPHLAQADTWITEFSTGSIKARVARLIHFLSNFEFGEESKKVELLKVEECADILGVTPESTSRIMAEFKRNRILQKIPNFHPETYQLDAEKLRLEAW